MVLDQAGNIYIVDMTNVLIYKMSPQGRLEVLAGKYQISGAGDGPGKDALFRYPLGVALDKDGNVYVADAGNRLVRKISPAGMVTTFGPAMAIFSRVAGVDFPTGIAMDAAENIYLASNYDNTVSKITPDGTVTIIAGKAGVDGSVDGKRGEVLFGKPRAVAVDGAGVVYVIDEEYNTIRKIALDGSVTTLAGNPAVAEGNKDGMTTEASFTTPRGLAVDAKGNVYVGDSGNHVVRKITPAGVVTTFAGHAGAAGSADGKGDAARFDTPRGLAVDKEGNIFVADAGNAAIRKIAPDGMVTTVYKGGTTRPTVVGSPLILNQP